MANGQGILEEIFRNDKDAGPIEQLPDCTMAGSLVSRHVRQVNRTKDTEAKEDQFGWYLYIRGIDDSNIESIEIHSSKESASVPCGDKMRPETLAAVWYRPEGYYYGSCFFQKWNCNQPKLPPLTWLTTHATLLVTEIGQKATLILRERNGSEK